VVAVRIAFEDHARFHRAVLSVAAVSSAVACAAALAGSERFSPATAVLGAAIATLALALGHARWVADTVMDALARAAREADADGRALLARAGAARAAITRAARRQGALASDEGRALVTAAAQAATAVAELSGRRHRLARRVREAQAADADAEAQALDRRASAATDPTARESYARATAALRERVQRAAAMSTLIDRCDARLVAAVAELEGTALAVGTRAELGAGDPPAALVAACDRLRLAGADLGTECDALAEVGAV
jgi:hypothetical protein